jgi:primosomal protein N' (replication factor Y)
LLWAAAERVRPDGQVVIQSQHPAHYAFGAVLAQDLAAFYTPELRFRAELGYPPFRRLALVTLRAGEAAAAKSLAAAVTAALGGGRGVTVYPPVAGRDGRTQRLVVKGGPDLPRGLAEALAEFQAPRPRRRGIMDVEVDPVEWS